MNLSAAPVEDVEQTVTQISEQHFPPGAPGSPGPNAGGAGGDAGSGATAVDGQEAIFNLIFDALVGGRRLTGNQVVANTLTLIAEAGDGGDGGETVTGAGGNGGNGGDASTEGESASIAAATVRLDQGGTVRLHQNVAGTTLGVASAGVGGTGGAGSAVSPESGGDGGQGGEAVTAVDHSVLQVSDVDIALDGQVRVSQNANSNLTVVAAGGNGEAGASGVNQSGGSGGNAQASGQLAAIQVVQATISGQRGNIQQNQQAAIDVTVEALADNGIHGSGPGQLDGTAEGESSLVQVANARIQGSGGTIHQDQRMTVDHRVTASASSLAGEAGATGDFEGLSAMVAEATNGASISQSHHVTTQSRVLNSDAEMGFSLISEAQAANGTSGVATRRGAGVENAGGQLVMQGGGQGTANVSQVITLNVNNLQGSITATQTAAAWGGQGGNSDLSIGPEAQLRLGSGSRVEVLGGRGGTASVSQSINATRGSSSVQSAEAFGGRGGDAVLMIGRGAQLDVDNSSSLSIQAGMGGLAQISQTGQGNQSVVLQGQRGFDATLQVGEGARLHIANGSRFVQGASEEGGSDFVLAPGVDLAISSSWLTVSGSPLQFEDNTSMTLWNSELSLSETGNVLLSRNAEGATWMLRNQGGATGTGASLNSQLQTDADSRLMLDGSRLYIQGDLDLGGALLMENAQLHVGGDIWQRVGSTILFNAHVSAQLMSVGDGRSMFVESSQGVSQQWQLNELHVEGGSGGLLDLGQTRLHLAANTTPSLFQLGTEGRQGGELRVSYFMENDSLQIGGIEADRAIIHSGSTLRVTRGQGVGSQALWRTLAGDGVSLDIVSASGESDIQRPDTVHLPSYRLLDLAVTAQSHSLVFQGSARSAADYINELGLTGQAALTLPPLIDNAGYLSPRMFDFLEEGQSAEVQTLGEQVAADVTGVGAAVALRVHSMTDPLMDDRFRLLRAERSGDRGGHWMQAMIATQNQNGQGDISGYDISSHGFTVGTDRRNENGVVLGAALSVARSMVAYQGVRQANRLDTESALLSLYGGWMPEDKAWFVQWQAELGNHRYRDSRVVSAINDWQQHRRKGLSYQGQLTAGFDIQLVDNASLSPFVRMNLSRVKMWDGHFGGELARNESVVDPIRVEPEVGAQFSARLLEDDDKVLVLRASSSVGYDLRNQAHDGHLQFTDVGGRVWLPGLEENTTTLRSNLAFDLRKANGFTFSLVYSGAYRGDMEGHAGMFQGRYRF